VGYRVSLFPGTGDASHYSYVAALSLDGVLAAVSGLAGQRAPETAERKLKVTYPCPCGTGLRLGRYRNRKLNILRDKLGRRWFASLLYVGR
jgi:hypothetical protein